MTFRPAVSLAGNATALPTRPKNDTENQHNAKSYSPEAEAQESASSTRAIEAADGLSAQLRHQDASIEDESHCYLRTAWKPDLTFVSQEFVDKMCSEMSDDLPFPIDQLIDIVAHKKPGMKVLEANTIPGHSSVVWFNLRDEASIERTCRSIVMTSNDPFTLTQTKGKVSDRDVDSFQLMDLLAPAGSIQSPKEKYDFIILKCSASGGIPERQIIKNARSLIKDDGQLMFVGYILLEEVKPDTEDGAENLPTGIKCQHWERLLESEGFTIPLRIKCANPQKPERPQRGYLASVSHASTTSGAQQASQSIDIVAFDEGKPLLEDIPDLLRLQGWGVTRNSVDKHVPESDAFVLVLDEVMKSMLTSCSESQWIAIRQLILSNRRILWLTKGIQAATSEPERALIYGLTRAIRADYPSSRIKLLDVENESTWELSSTIDQIFRSFDDSENDYEFAEIDSVIHISRVLINDRLNQAELKEVLAQRPQPFYMHQANTRIQLRCDRPGNVNSLCFTEVASEELPLADQWVEIEIHAAGLNLKDVDAVLGNVPKHKHVLGLEGAGTIRRVGRSIYQSRIGERVLVYKSGTLSNRMQANIENVHAIPDGLSFEQASTLAYAYGLSLYSLVDLANIKPGQRVLIHSAADDVGIAAINICKHVGAQIYATVESEYKRKYLADHFGIPQERIFSSQSPEFVRQIMQSTGRKGVYVILNFLSGDLLHETWTCVADGGTMIDMSNRAATSDSSKLSMEPFNRNASYRAVDLSHQSVSNDTIANILSEIFQLLNDGKIRPILPMKTFGFQDIPAAIDYLHNGNHIGKVVISNASADFRVPVRRMPLKLLPSNNVSYLVVGELKGLCGSVAVSLAKLGAGSLISLSRKGLNDKEVRSTYRTLSSLGCSVRFFRGDAATLSDVRRVFEQAPRPVVGVVLGPVDLGNPTYEKMTSHDFHEIIQAKINGARNLHNVSEAFGFKLQFFTLLSRISGVVGEKSQVDVAAASAFLDSFALFRKSKGLPACSVYLGDTQDIDYNAEDPNRVLGLGNQTLCPQVSETILQKLITRSIQQQSDAPIHDETSSQIITGIRVPQYFPSPLLNDARFSHLRATERSHRFSISLGANGA